MHFQVTLLLLPVAVIAGGSSWGGNAPPPAEMTTWSTSIGYSPVPQVEYHTSIATVWSQSVDTYYSYIDHSTTYYSTFYSTMEAWVPTTVVYVSTSYVDVLVTTTISIDHTVDVGSLTVSIQTVDVGSLTIQTMDVGSLTIQTMDVGSLTIQTETSTITAPPVEVTVSYTAFVTTTFTELTSKCDFCKVDIYGTELLFPTVLSTVALFATTYHLYTTFNNGIATTVTSTSYAPDCIGSPPTPTWLWNGVELTSGTTYIGYITFSHEYLFPSASVAGGCGLSTLPIDLPGITDWAALVIATASAPTTPTLAPSQIVNYLDSFPTVIAQLNGTLAADCDAPTQTVLAAAQPTVTGTSYSTISGSVIVKHLPNGLEDVQTSQSEGTLTGSSSVNPTPTTTVNATPQSNPGGGSPSSNTGAAAPPGSSSLPATTGTVASPQGSGNPPSSGTVNAGGISGTPTGSAVSTIYTSAPASVVISIGSSTITIPASEASTLGYFPPSPSVGAAASSLLGVGSSLLGVGSSFLGEGSSSLASSYFGAGSSALAAASSVLASESSALGSGSSTLLSGSSTAPSTTANGFSSSTSSAVTSTTSGPARANVPHDVSTIVLGGLAAMLLWL